MRDARRRTRRPGARRPQAASTSARSHSRLAGFAAPVHPLGRSSGSRVATVARSTRPPSASWRRSHSISPTAAPWAHRDTSMKTSTGTGAERLMSFGDRCASKKRASRASSSPYTWSAESWSRNDAAVAASKAGRLGSEPRNHALGEIEPILRRRHELRHVGRQVLRAHSAK